MGNAGQRQVDRVVQVTHRAMHIVPSAAGHHVSLEYLNIRFASTSAVLQNLMVPMSPWKDTGEGGREGGATHWHELAVFGQG